MCEKKLKILHILLLLMLLLFFIEEQTTHYHVLYRTVQPTTEKKCRIYNKHSTSRLCSSPLPKKILPCFSDLLPSIENGNKKTNRLCKVLSFFTCILLLYGIFVHDNNWKKGAAFLDIYSMVLFYDGVTFSNIWL